MRPRRTGHVASGAARAVDRRQLPRSACGAGVGSARRLGTLPPLPAGEIRHRPYTQCKGRRTRSSCRLSRGCAVGCPHRPQHIVRRLPLTAGELDILVRGLGMRTAMRQDYHGLEPQHKDISGRTYRSAGPVRHDLQRRRDRQIREPFAAQRVPRRAGRGRGGRPRGLDRAPRNS